ncbi:DUF6251 family protein [Streptomyces sp. PA03-6a]|nr:DUF6251 family protein [Streptomyces sp. PA03-6a]
MSTPRRYRFDNPMPSTEPARLPVRQEIAQANLLHNVQEVPQPQVVHIHEAPPDRTLQRVALGAGIGGGAIVAGIYFLPMLILAVQSLVAALMSLVVMLAVAAWAVVTIVNAVGGKNGQATAQALSRRRRGLLRRRR